VAHRDTVIHADGIELEWHAASITDGFFHDPTKFLEMNVTWDQVDVGVTDSNERSVKVLV